MYLHEVDRRQGIGVPVRSAEEHQEDTNEGGQSEGHGREDTRGPSQFTHFRNGRCKVKLSSNREREVE